VAAGQMRFHQLWERKRRRHSEGEPMLAAAMSAAFAQAVGNYGLRWMCVLCNTSKPTRIT